MAIHTNSLDLRTFRLSLNDVVKKDMKSNKENVVDPVLNVELMSKASIYKFQGNVLSPFIKITLAIPRLIAAVKRLVSGGDVPGVPSTTRVRSPEFDSSRTDFHHYSMHFPICVSWQSFFVLQISSSPHLFEQLSLLELSLERDQSLEE